MRIWFGITVSKMCCRFDVSTRTVYPLSSFIHAFEWFFWYKLQNAFIYVANAMLIHKRIRGHIFVELYRMDAIANGIVRCVLFAISLQWRHGMSAEVCYVCSVGGLHEKSSNESNRTSHDVEQDAMKYSGWDAIGCDYMYMGIGIKLPFFLWMTHS